METTTSDDILIIISEELSKHCRAYENHMKKRRAVMAIKQQGSHTA